MEAVFEKLSPAQIVAVISVFSGCVVALAMVFAIAKYQLQSLADETALKRERQQAALALKEKVLERGEVPSGLNLDLLLAPDRDETDPEEMRLNAELAKRFGSLDAPAGEVEEVLARAMTADPVRKRGVIAVLDELLESDAKPGVILAAVRPLCGGAAREAAAAGA